MQSIKIIIVIPKMIHVNLHSPFWLFKKECKCLQRQCDRLWLIILKNDKKKLIFWYWHFIYYYVMV
jgi:hypothetical protein